MISNSLILNSAGAVQYDDGHTDTPIEPARIKCDVHDCDEHAVKVGDGTPLCTKHILEYERDAAEANEVVIIETLTI